MNDMPKMTHKGFFGICPVYFADLDADCPFVDPRHWIFEPLFWLSESVYGLLITVGSMINPDYDPEWPLFVTGELHDKDAQG